MKAVLLLALLVGSSSAFAFKWAKCKKVYNLKSPQAAPKGFDVFQATVHALADYTTQTTTNSSSSTTSYVSSTGDCAAFAKAEEERKLFIADSMTAIKLESAEGHGEHVTSLATLYGCDSGSRQGFIKMMRYNHSEIFTNESQSTEDVNIRILNRVMGSKDLRNSCLVGS